MQTLSPIRQPTETECGPRAPAFGLYGRQNWAIMRLFLSIHLMLMMNFFLDTFLFSEPGMKVTFSLQPILRDNHLDQRGIILDLASQTGITRNRVSAYYRGLRNKISLDDLGKLCAWLVELGVDSARLPGALFT